MAAIQYPPLDSPSTARTLYTSTPWTDPSGGQWLWSVAKGRWSPVAEASSVTVDTTITDGSTNAVSSNAVFDALALKAPLASPTFTGPVTAANAASGTGAEIYSDSGTGAEIYSNSGTGAYISSNSGTGAYISGEASGTGAEIYSDSGTGAYISSTSGTGAEISSNSGTYHAAFGDTGIDRSFVARLKGAFGWIRGAFTGRIHPPDTLTGDRTWELPDASGTLALTSDIDTFAKLNAISGGNLARTDAGQTFAGAQAFSGQISSSGSTDATNTNNVVNVATNDARYGRFYFAKAASSTVVNNSTALVDVGCEITLPAGTYRVSGMIISNHNTAAGSKLQLTLSASCTVFGCLYRGRASSAITPSTLTAGSVASLAAVETSGTDYHASCQFTVVVTSSTTLKWQQAQNTAHASNSTTAAGAWLMAEKIG